MDDSFPNVDRVSDFYPQQPGSITNSLFRTNQEDISTMDIYMMLYGSMNIYFFLPSYLFFISHMLHGAGIFSHTTWSFWRHVSNYSICGALGVHGRGTLNISRYICHDLM
jgi:hypothetical protein